KAIWRAEQLSAEALLLRCGDVRTANSCERRPAFANGIAAQLYL
ncbi:hypothetical protein HMPREF1578_00001, partial [Gardnerella pickettii JCP8017B]